MTEVYAEGRHCQPAERGGVFSKYRVRSGSLLDWSDRQNGLPRFAAKNSRRAIGCIPSDSIAELPVMPAATNLVSAIAKFATIAP